jgi:hypothetical protein
MTTDIKNNITHKQYLAHKGADLYTQVNHSIAVVTKTDIVIAGFHPSGEVLVVEQFSEIQSELVLIQTLSKSSLLKNNPRAVFVDTSKIVIIPEELYTSDDEAKSILKQLHYIDKNESLLIVKEEKNKIFFVFAIDSNLFQALSKMHLNILPIQKSHFYHTYAVDQFLYCTVFNDSVIGTLKLDGKIVWHQHFIQEGAEDILYKLGSVCSKFNLEQTSLPVHINCATINEVTLVDELKLYFKNEQVSTTNISDILSPEWTSTIRFIQQLNLCAS